jgi:pantoate--beta-alanine ligase
MRIFKEIEPLRAYLKQLSSPPFSVGLVPTMGALHPGHLSLIDASKKHNEITVCSIYVNPTQFTNPADLTHYPRTLDRDIAMLSEAGCDVLFCPKDEEMYGTAPATTFDVGLAGTILEGEFRPGHFNGVALVVSKLFNIIQPRRAYFGQKDFQQFIIIDQLVRDLKFDLELFCAPIIREPDGLAMSSRNMRLSPDERKRAAVLYQCLVQTRNRLLNSEPFELLKKEMKDYCSRHQVILEYLALANRKNLSVSESPDHAVLLIAARVGEIRLIDNLFVIE